MKSYQKEEKRLKKEAGKGTYISHSPSIFRIIILLEDPDTKGARERRMTSKGKEVQGKLAETP